VQKPPFTPLAVGSLGAARLMGISRSRIYDLKNTGELPFYKDGRRTLFIVADIEARIARLKSAPVSTGPLLPEEDRKKARRRASSREELAIEQAPPPAESQQPIVEQAQPAVEIAVEQPAAWVRD
jgi:excisionase family DNA binding protein